MLHAVVREHLETFLAEARRRSEGEGQGLPPFVEDEFRECLTCGVLAHGFARVRCDTCAFERLVPFSCKGRGFCPSCGGRRITERAALLVTSVLPRVPVRQWVLSLPYDLRYVLAWDHALCRAVLGVFARVVLTFYRRGARREGIADGRTGTVTVIQRFGGGLNLNVHVHTLALDGTYAVTPAGALVFRAAPPPADAEIARLVVTVRARVTRLLVRRGAGRDTVRADPLVEASPVLASSAARRCSGAWRSARGRGGACGGSARRRTRRGSARRARKSVPLPAPPAARAGAVVARPGRAGGGRAQAAVAGRHDPPRVRAAGAAGETGGADAAPPREPDRVSRHSRAPRAVAADATEAAPCAATPPSPPQRRRHWRWADLLRRTFDVDVLACPRCGNRLRLVATSEDPGTVRAILAELGLPSEPVRPDRAQPPPSVTLFADLPA